MLCSPGAALESSQAANGAYELPTGRRRIDRIIRADSESTEIERRTDMRELWNANQIFSFHLLGVSISLNAATNLSDWLTDWLTDLLINVTIAVRAYCISILPAAVRCQVPLISPESKFSFNYFLCNFTTNLLPLSLSISVCEWVCVCPVYVDRLTNTDNNLFASSPLSTLPLFNVSLLCYLWIWGKTWKCWKNEHTESQTVRNENAEVAQHKVNGV